MNNSLYSIDSLCALKDNALLLMMANEYLCEEKILIKIGQSIELNLQRLKDDISLIKKEFPGKFVSEVDT